MENYESIQPGGSGKTFGHREEKRAGASRIRSAFNNASDKLSGFMNNTGQNISNEWEKHAQIARKSKSALVRFLEGALGMSPEDETAYEF